MEGPASFEEDEGSLLGGRAGSAGEDEMGLRGVVFEVDGPRTCSISSSSSFSTSESAETPTEEAEGEIETKELPSAAYEETEAFELFPLSRCVVDDVVPCVGSG